jgi:DsbC/DsbD-like thiol-disulfide interchange protein
LLGVTLLAVLPAGASDTATTPNAAIRLLDGGAADALRMSGVEIVLEPKWKTYWRVPGDTGVPPEFDFTGSTNAARIDVLWPAPRRLRDAEGGEVIGYEDGVVFPVKVTPANPAQPVDLTLKLHFAVCHDICLPAEATLERRLEPQSTGPDAAAIAAAVALVPSDSASSSIAVQNVSIEPPASSGGEPALVVDLKGDGLGGETDILVEGPPTAYFSAPQEGGSPAQGVHRYRLPISVTGDVAALKGAVLTLTILAGETRLVRTATIR